LLFTLYQTIRAKKVGLVKFDRTKKNLKKMRNYIYLLVQVFKLFFSLRECS
jgi:hypothetical protein